MDSLTKNWKAIKDLAWNPFPSKQLYFDEDENIFAVKGKDNSTIVVAYGHITGDNMFQSGVVDFIKDIKSVSKNKGWKKIIFKIILNIPLTRLKYLNSLRALPNDVEYFHFDTVRSRHNLPILQNLQQEIEDLVDRARRDDEDDVTDWESDIMKGLIGGDAEKHGF